MQRSETQPSPDGSPDQAPAATTVPVRVVLGIALVALVCVAGLPDLAAPWIQGDEFTFIVNNPLVNPAADPGRPAALIQRIGDIFTTVHRDLYQPIPLATYAVEWELSGGAPVSFRRTDVLLHALNALLLWAVLRRMLAHSVTRKPAPLTWFAWFLALLWALHPALVTAYASDMGRTHLLATMFVLLTVLLHLHALRTQRAWPFLVSLGTLVLAMLCKPVPGWFLVVFVLEVVCRDWKQALLSYRVYVAGLICVAFGGFTLWTSTTSGLAEDASQGLFGDPIARSLNAVWIYARDIFMPLWVRVWHIPDPRTGWAYWPVWAGLLLTLASIGHAFQTWRRQETRAAAIGWVWFWATLLPVIGLMGAREIAAADRYLYLPLMGLLVVLGVEVLRMWAYLLVSGMRTVPVRRASAAVAGLVALGMLSWDLPLTGMARSTLQRALRVRALHPDDPRAQEKLAAAYDFCRNHAIPAADRARIPADVGQGSYFRERWIETLYQAAANDRLDFTFPTPEDRAPFHRRLSYSFLRAGEPRASLEQAQIAHEYQPDTYLTWKRLAHGYQAVGNYEAAADAYAHAEQLLPETVEARRAHYADYAYLLMFELQRDREACPRFAKALETEHPSLQARMGAALCQIRFGEGEVGFRLISAVLEDPALQAQPRMFVHAGLVLAEYHLRSHHWREAYRVYNALLRDHPTNYAALRGFHEVCLQIDRMPDAVARWRDAVAFEPERRAFTSYLAWALALEGAPANRDELWTLVEKDPASTLATAAAALASLRGGDLERGVELARQVAGREETPHARAVDRLAAALRLLGGRGEAGPAWKLVVAALYAHPALPDGYASEAVSIIDSFVVEHGSDEHAVLVERVRSWLSVPTSNPG